MSRRRCRPRCRWLAALLAALLLLLAGGCGLPEDSSPQALPRENLPPDLLDPNPSASSSVPDSGPTVVVYFLEERQNGVRLARVQRRVPNPRTPEDRLEVLFAGLEPDEPDAGLSTQIPADTVLRGVETDPETDTVIVNVSGDLLTRIEGPALSQAFAQIVWTATEPAAGGYDSVRFLVDGVPRTVIDGDGVERAGPVSRSDYSNFSPP
jgi:spore germination protein GerM